MIEGLRPVFGVGPATAPALPTETARSEPAARQSEVAPVAPVAEAERSGMQTGHHDSGAQDQHQKGTGHEATGREPGDPGYREPRLPQLSAEALATALMDAEPPKAIVPRILPPEAGE